jgi:hypothetical protein
VLKRAGVLIAVVSLGVIVPATATAASSDGQFFPCTDTFAKQVATASGFADLAAQSNPNYSNSNFWLATQTVCADFDLDGNDEMAFTLGAMGGNDPWAFFDVPNGRASESVYVFPTISGGRYPNRGLEFVQVEGIPAIRDTRRLFRHGDAHCCPAGGTSIRVVGFIGGSYGVLESSIERAPAPPHRTRLTVGMARSAAVEFLGRKYGEQWYGRYGGRLNCNRKTGFSSRKCYVSFGIGDAIWYGSVGVSLAGRIPNQRFRIRYRIKRLDEYCAVVQHGPPARCIKTERGASHLQA